MELKNKKNTLILGGCRSGKSRHALDIAKRIPGSKKIFIATSVPTDPEMEIRVKNHQTERGDDWITMEIPIHLSGAIHKVSLFTVLGYHTCGLSDLVDIEYDDAPIFPGEYSCHDRRFDTKPKSFPLPCYPCFKRGGCRNCS